MSAEDDLKAFYEMVLAAETYHEFRNLMLIRARENFAKALEQEQQAARRQKGTGQ